MTQKVKTVKDCKVGDYIRINGKSPIYKRGEYDHSLKRYHLIDVRDIWGNGRYVKGSTIADNDFIY